MADLSLSIGIDGADRILAKDKTDHKFTEHVTLCVGDTIIAFVWSSDAAYLRRLADAINAAAEEPAEQVSA